MKSAPFVFAGGGTGGHLFPGIAVAEALRALQPGAELTFLTTNRPLDRELLRHTAATQIEQAVQPFTLHPLRAWGFWRSWRASVAAAGRLFREKPPRAVLGLGGYAAGPAVVAAAKMEIPAAILNPDAVPGRANQYLARRSRCVVLQWDVSRRHFPAGVRCEALGCPIRRDFAAVERASAARKFGLDPARPVLLVTGASQGARTINEALARLWPDFTAAHPNWQLLHLTGAADEASVRSAYERAALPAAVLAFTHEMSAALSAADLVISRAGASTLAELTCLGKPAILLPYPYHKDQHQRVNAHVLVDAGAAICLSDTREPVSNAAAIRAALERLTDDAARATMAAAARKLGRPDASAAVARLLCSL